MGQWEGIDEVCAGTIPEGKENNPECLYLT